MVFSRPSSQGGHFTEQGEDGFEYRQRRSKNIPFALIENPGSAGYFGSDVWLELGPIPRNKLEFKPVIEAPTSFALACRKDETQRFQNLREFKRGINIVTSYPNQARLSLGLMGVCISSIRILGGSVEGGLVDYPEADMIYEMVETGNSIRDNDLAIIKADLGRLVIGESWRKDC